MPKMYDNYPMKDKSIMIRFDNQTLTMLDDLLEYYGTRSNAIRSLIERAYEVKHYKKKKKFDDKDFPEFSDDMPL